MFCAKCEKNLLACECEDLAERVENLKTCEFLYLTPDQWKALEARGRLNKEEKTKQE
jgi:hypothetical protein